MLTISPMQKMRYHRCRTGFVLQVSSVFIVGLAFIFAMTSAALPKDVKIGALFLGKKTDGPMLNPLEEPMEKAFLHAVDRVNAVRSILPKFRLIAITDRIVAGDSFHASKKVCNMVRQGVFGIFGPSMAPMASHIQSVSNSLEIPHIETRWDFTSERSRLSLNLHPHPASLSRAVRDLIGKWKWKSFAVLYDDKQGLVRLQKLFKLDYPTKVKIFVRQLIDGQDFRQVLKEVKKTGETRIIIDCHGDRIVEILLQAQQLGMMTHYHSYLITSLDFHTVDLHGFQHAATNITGFRIVNLDASLKASHTLEQIFSPIVSGQTSIGSAPLKLQVALMFDAVIMFARTLTNAVDKNNTISMQSASCEKGSSSPWIYGNGIIQLMKNMKSSGLTGRIDFNKTDGFRKEFNLDIVTLRSEGLRKIGMWNLTYGVNLTTSLEETMLNTTEYLSKYALRVTTKLSKPYVMLKPNAEQFSGYQKYEGFCVDLMEEIAKYVKMNFTIQLVKDNSYGVYTAATGEWDGVIKELIEQEADIGIGDLTINYDREKAVDFTMPFMNLGISIMYKKPMKKDANLFSFLSPFSVDVWMYMITAYLGVSILLFLLARFNPYDWENPHPCDPNPEELENKFSLMNSMWFTIGSLMQQGSDVAPKAISTRLVAGIWWFFTLIMISSYTASLAAFLTNERMTSPINSVEDLASQTKIKYGCVKTGTTLAFFQKSSLAVYQNMWSTMVGSQPTVFTNDNQEGIDRVMKGGYAYVMESTANEYYRYRYCDLVQVGTLLDSKSYGIATTPGSPFRTMLSRAVLHLQHEGVLEMLKIKWWKQKYIGDSQCVAEKTGSSAASELDLASVGGVFVVLLGGLGIACVIGIVEFVWKTRTAVQRERGDVKAELIRELKFALNFKGSNSKPVTKKPDGDNTTGMSVPLASFG